MHVLPKYLEFEIHKASTDGNDRPGIWNTTISPRYRMIRRRKNECCIRTGKSGDTRR